MRFHSNAYDIIALFELFLHIGIGECAKHEIGSYTDIKYAPCPKLCNGNGLCHRPGGICKCFDGFTGVDCSLLTCPVGIAWADYSSGNDLAHAQAECSNRGICNRKTGLCECEYEKFEGVACERKSCPKNCNGNGRCVSMKNLASMDDPGVIMKSTGGCTTLEICVDSPCNTLDYSKCTETFTYTEPWETEKMFGCVCDKGFSGYDCSIRTCPTGDDPLTASQLNEIQLLECRATSGTFTLTFMGETTKRISFDASSSELETTLTSLRTIRRSGSDPTVAISYDGSTACAEDGNDIQITFLQNFGDLPLLIPDGTNLVHSSLTPILTNPGGSIGTKENDVCSNRGFCTQSTGVCDCLDYWITSNGYSGAGTRGDCGYLQTGTTSSCPGATPCLGYGICSNSPEYRCDCQNGRFGPDCSLISCPTGKSWFSYPSSDNVAHVLAECSNMGICDTSSGTCSCADGFTGAACEYMKCPGNPGRNPLECSGHGVCATMAMLAQYSYTGWEPSPHIYGTDANNYLTWDYDQIQGCHCSEGWEGYDCSLRSCPKGDNPQTSNQFNEIQELSCTDSDDLGSFKLKFGGQTTDELNLVDTAATLETKINALVNIESVSVTYSDPNIYVGADGLAADALQVCRSSSQAIQIEFYVPTGDLPLISIESAIGVDGTLALVEQTKGTKEYMTCSGRGICDNKTGQCTCSTGFVSSDGKGNAGSRGDCGYKSPYIPG